MLTDEQLLERIQHGDEASLEQLVERYYQVIYSYLARMLMNPMLAEDLTQECFMKVCALVKEKRLPSAFRPWIYRVAGNLCRDYWRKASTRLEKPTEQERLAANPDVHSVASIVEKQFEREVVAAQLLQLDKDERQMIVLRFFHDLKIAEIAEVMEMPLNTLKSKLYKSFNKLAKLMREKEGEEHGRQRMVR